MYMLPIDLKIGKLTLVTSERTFAALGLVTGQPCSLGLSYLTWECKSSCLYLLQAVTLDKAVTLRNGLSPKHVLTALPDAL